MEVTVKVQVYITPETEFKKIPSTVVNTLNDCLPNLGNQLNELQVLAAQFKKENTHATESNNGLGLQPQFSASGKSYLILTQFSLILIQYLLFRPNFI